MANDTLKLPSVLAFERKLDPSDALFFSGQWADRDQPAAWTPVPVREKSVRGTISNRIKVKGRDPAKLDAAIENPNPQTVDIATLPGDRDTLKVQFTLRVLGGLGEPSACNDGDYRRKLLDTTAAYIASQGLDELARRYAANLANGRFLWRNRVGAEQVEIQVARLQQGQVAEQWTFQALDHDQRRLQAPATEGAALTALAGKIAQALAGQSHLLLQITAYLRVGGGQEVFPSQELILDRSANKKKTLYRVGEGEKAIAAFHSQKIGNALRTIDTWYPEADANGPIAVEPYGSVTTQGEVYRPNGSKKDFYSLLDNWLLKDLTPAVEQQHFVMAVLIRGGVFGAGKEAS